MFVFGSRWIARTSSHISEASEGTTVITYKFDIRIHVYNMPRIAAVSVDNAVEIIVAFGAYFRTNKLPNWSSNIWEKMSTALNNKWNAQCVYTNVTNNRRGILDLARQRMDITVLDIPDSNNNYSLDETAVDAAEKSSSNEDSLKDNWTLEKNEPLEIFDLVLTEQEWKEIKPDSIQLDLNDNPKRQKFNLKPGVWTNIVSIAMWQQFRMPCAFVFKRADVSLSDEETYIIKITGRCKSTKCGNKFIGSAEKTKFNEGLTIAVKMQDMRSIKHDIVKRPLNGVRRKTVRKELKSEGGAVWKKQQARKYMRPGDIEPPILPHGHVLRQARQEGIDADLSVKKSDGRDLVRTIEDLALKPEYCNIIHSVGSRPFHVFYHAPPQLHAYKEYCRLNKESSFICIDATGSVVQPINRFDGTRSGHIFLYSIVINFDSTTIAVNQMLSEQHDTEFIEFWLKRWIRAGAPKPKEVISDYSRALLSAISLAFNNQTVKAYVQLVFSIISNPNIGGRQKPSTLIRIDIAHLIHLVCRWKCFKSLRHVSIKEFFVRCVALMAECTSIYDFENVFILTCTVGVQTHEDSRLVIPQAETAKEARKNLENLIAKWTIEIDFNNIDPTDEKKKDRPESFNLNDINEPDDSNENNINEWIDQRIFKASNMQSIGQDLNAFYLPDLVKNLSRLCREFPLWTKVGMNRTIGRATSSYVESYFNDIKRRVFRNMSRPIRVDKFIKVHARDISGATSLFSSKLIQYNVENEQPKNYSSDVIPVQDPDRPNKQKYIENSDLVPSENRDVRGEQLNCNNSDLGSIQKWEKQDSTSYVEDSCLLFPGNDDMQDKQPNNLDLGSVKKWEKQDSTIYVADSCLLLSGHDDMQDEQPIKNSLDLVSTQNWESKDKQPCFKDSDLLSTENWRGKAAPKINDADGLEISIDLNLAMGNLLSSTQLEDKLPDNAGLIRLVLNDHSYSKIEGFTALGNISGDASYRELNPSASVEELDANVELNLRPGLMQVSERKHENAVMKTCKLQPKPVKMSKYFKPHPEICHMNTLLTKPKKAVLLINGLRCPAVNLNKQAFFVHKTCGFDAFVQILLTAAIDNVEYFSFIENSTNATLQLVLRLIRDGITQRAYCERMMILKEFCPSSIQVSTDKRVVSHVIDAELSIASTIEKVMESEPSVKNIEECSHSGHRIYPTMIIAPNHKIIGTQGFGRLAQALGWYSPVFNIRCRDPCPGKYTLFRESNNHIFIELDIRPSLETTCGLKCKLQQIPTTLQLQQTPELTYQYRLAGIVAYTPGHYMAYCLRLNGIWEIHNDLRSGISTCSSNTEIEGHLVVYIRKNDRN